MSEPSRRQWLDGLGVQRGDRDAASRFVRRQLVRRRLFRLAVAAERWRARLIEVVRQRNGAGRSRRARATANRSTVRAMAAARRRLPLLPFVSLGGADAAEGVAALDGWAGAAKELTANSHIVPSIAITSGPTVSGPALMLGLVDHVIMTADAYAFVSGPLMVEQFTGVPMSKEELGGSSVHDRTSRVASFVVGTEEEAKRSPPSY